MSTGEVMRPAVAALLVSLLLAVPGCQASATPEQARQVLAAVDQGDPSDGLGDVLNSPDAAAVVADAVAERIRVAVARGLDPLPDPLISPARFSDPILSELREDPLLLSIMERSGQTGDTWARALHVTLRAEVPGVEPVAKDHVRSLDVRLALADFVMWLLWSDTEVRPILVEREPDAPEQVDFDAFRRFAYARNVAVGVSNPLSRQLLGAAP